MKTKEKKEAQNTNEKKKKKGKIVKKILLILLVIIVAVAGVTAINNTVVVNAHIIRTEGNIYSVTTDDPLIPEQDENGYWTFTTNRDLKVLQLTDVHIGGGWMSSKKDSMALNAVAQMVTAERPDLVIVTGDVSYPVPFQAGTFNNMSGAKIFAALMERLGVYWTLGYGNHDTEAYSYFGREDLSDFYENDEFKYCLFQRGPEDVDGFGNQVINVKNSDGVITQSLFILDSHSYVDGDVLGVMWKYDNIHENQVEWYKNTLSALNAQNDAVYEKLGTNEKSDIKSAAFFHIPLTEQKDAWHEFAENGYEDTENVKLIYGTAGESGKVVYSGIHEDEMFETMLELGSTQAVFCGHDHYNNFSVDYKGIRLTYGMSVDYLAYPGIYKIGSQRGCTVITFSPDGSFDCKAESYYQEKYTGLAQKEEVTMQEIVTIPYDEIVKE